MNCTPDPQRRAILCGPRGQRPTPGDLAALAEFEQFLRDRHTADQRPDDQPSRPENRP